MAAAADRGYSLIELLVTLAVMGVVVLAAAQLVGESASLFHATDRAVSSPALARVTGALRRDVQAAVGLPVVSPSWARRPLELVGWDGGRVRYVLENRSLVRLSFDQLGRPAGRRLLASGVSSWKWRSITPLVVEVSLSIAAGPNGDNVAATGVELRATSRRFAFRGWPNGRSW
jgi:prepilin-type N-terminal cleavage/methylation domain-containing protein